MSDVYIISAKRTPIGKSGGVFKHERPDDLLSFVLKQLTIDNLDPNLIDDVIIGCAMPEAEQGLNVARIALLLADYPISVPGMTLNRFCASSLEAIAIAASKIKSGIAKLVVAGGVESMSMVPMGGHSLRINPRIFSDENIGIAYGMGTTAEQIVAKYKIDRRLQDEFALKSHQKAIKAMQSGCFKDEILPYESQQMIYNKTSKTVDKISNIITSDEGVRADTSMEKLAALRSVFAKGGSVTAGNSSQTSDAAAAVILCNEQMLKILGVEPLARFITYAVSGVEPKIMGIGPVLAVPKALKQCGFNKDDIAHIELNEAFAAQSLAVIDELKFNSDLVNPLGGAIALGHPLGASGAIRTATLLHHLKRKGKKYGMVTMCIGTGMGAAAVFEAL